MLNIRFLKIVCVLCAIALAASACSRSADKEASSALLTTEGLLQYVPADTPYAFVMAEPMPEDVLDKMRPHIDSILASYRHVLELVIGEQTGESGEDPENAARVAQFSSVAAEFLNLMSIEGLRNAGLSLKSRSAFYGVGLLSVLRVELIDVEAFEATIARLEEKIGDAMSVASIDGQSYRYLAAAEARLVIAVIDGYLVVTVVPTALSAEQLSVALGLTLPEHNIAAAGVLNEFANEYGYTGHVLGFLDIERLIAIFLDHQPGMNAELLALMDFDGSTLSDMCRAEIREMSGIMPRIVAGYTEISVTNIRSHAIFEIRNDIATGLATLAAAVPGLGKDHGGLFSFGMSLDLLAARDFYLARLDALEADPYECELFAELQNGVAKGRETLNQPIPPIAYGIKGFLAVVDKIEGFDIAKQQPPTDVDMRVLVAIDNAEGLLAMGTMFSPELAALNLQPDGKPVKFEVPQAASQFAAAYIGMTENALGIAVGSNAESGLAELLLETASEPPPILSMQMDAGRYYEFLGESMLVGNVGETADGESVEMPPEVLQAMSDAMTEAGKLFERMSIDILLTERGIEFPTTMKLSD